MPLGMAAHWRRFQELSPTRTQTYDGPGPITYQEIDAWSRLWELELTGWDLTVLRTLDGVYLGILHDRRSKARAQDSESGSARGNGTPG